MKIHSDNQRKFPNGLKEFPSSLMSEENALKIHGQSLATLDSRGGMGYHEILANIFNLDMRTIFVKDTEKEEAMLCQIAGYFNNFGNN